MNYIKKTAILMLVIAMFASNLACQLIPVNEMSKAELLSENDQTNGLEFQDATINLFSGEQLK
ncbi:uncharacterized protein METZ01_LOCUS425516, partial [marine metagenome]